MPEQFLYELQITCLVIDNGLGVGIGALITFIAQLGRVQKLKAQLHILENRRNLPEDNDNSGEGNAA